MNALIAVLCDAATDYNGKLNLLGTFDTIIARQLPATHPQCSVALRFACDRSEEGKHQLRIELVDADGRGVIPPVRIPFEVVLAPDAIYLSRNFVINIQHLKFEQPGHFAISIIVDDQLLASIPLQVKHPPRPNP